MSDNRYDEDFKKSLAALHRNGKSQARLCREYGIQASALTKWIRQYSTVKTPEGDILTAKQIKELRKRNAQLEEQKLILKKAIAIFTPHSGKDFMLSIGRQISLKILLCYIKYKLSVLKVNCLNKTADLPKTRSLYFLEITEVFCQNQNKRHVCIHHKDFSVTFLTRQLYDETRFQRTWR